MTDATLPRPPSTRRLHRAHPLRSLAAALSSGAESTAQRLPDTRHLAMLARRLAPVTMCLFLAQSFFLAGYFFDPILNLPLGVLTVATLVAVTARDYRADVRDEELVDDLRRRSWEAAEDARRRQADLLQDVGRLGAAAVEAATPPAMVCSALGAMGPLLVDLLATPSVARQEQLVDELERAAVRACAELVGHADGGGQAVLYRKVGGRFDPRWPAGPWPSPPATAPRASEEAREMRLLLRRQRASQATTTNDHHRQVRASIPLIAGRRDVGVLVAQRRGERRLDGDELEALLVLGHVVAAASAAAHAARRHRAGASETCRARWARRRADVVTAVPSASLVRRDLAARLQAVAGAPGARQAVAAAVPALAPPVSS
jgi:hypothetical protein